jgi:periplasmic protein TonB
MPKETCGTRIATGIPILVRPLPTAASPARLRFFPATGADPRNHAEPMTTYAVDPARSIAPHRTLQRFLAVSVLVHAALLFGFAMPGRSPSNDAKTTSMTVSIVPREPIESVVPQRSKEPLPKLTERPLRPTPQSSPAAVPVAAALTPVPMPVPTPAPVPSADARPLAVAVADSGPLPAPGPSIPGSLPAAPTPVAAIAPVALTAAPPAPPERRGKPSTLWLAEYTQVMTNQVARVRTYPQIARLRGWEGTTVVTVQLAPDGSILDARVAQSSGHEVLDRQAISMVRRAEPMPPLPAASAGGSAGPLEVRLPIVFALASRD